VDCKVYEIIHNIHSALDCNLLCLNRRRHSFNATTIRHIFGFTANACTKQNWTLRLLVLYVITICNYTVSQSCTAYTFCSNWIVHNVAGASHKNKGTKEQRKISTCQKSCIVAYTVFDKLKFLFSIFCYLFLLLCEVPYTLCISV